MGKDKQLWPEQSNKELEASIIIIEINYRKLGNQLYAL